MEISEMMKMYRMRNTSMGWKTAALATPTKVPVRYIDPSSDVVKWGIRACQPASPPAVRPSTLLPASSVVDLSIRGHK
jgi:hypothetical protein